MNRKTLEFNSDKFMSDIRELTGEDTLRKISDKIDVSASTLSRLDADHDPDMGTFLGICQQLELRPGDYFIWYEWTLNPFVPPYSSEQDG